MDGHHPSARICAVLQPRTVRACRASLREGPRKAWKLFRMSPQGLVGRVDQEDGEEGELDLRAARTALLADLRATLDNHDVARSRATSSS